MKTFTNHRVTLALTLLLSATPLHAADTLEFLSGAKLEGRVVRIDKAGKTVAFEGVIAGRAIEKVYTYSQIHAVIYNGKRYELTPKSDKPTPKPGPATPAKTSAGSTGDGRETRTAAEVDRQIAAASGPPEWLDATPLDFPKSLDLSWPEKAPGGWNNQLNVGQYFWDIINPNPSRWRSGLKFSYHLLEMHKGNAAQKQRILSHLGSMYFNLFQDYARAANCWRQSAGRNGPGQDVNLAECYYRLGNKAMAAKLIIDPEARAQSVVIHPNMIKLWGDMGEPVKAAKLAEMCNQPGQPMHMPYLFAGDAYRTAGNVAKASEYYQKSLDAPAGQNKGQADKLQTRARASLEAIRLFSQVDLARIGDGAYRSSSIGYEGPVEVEVAVADHKITSVKVTNHREKQFYSSMEDVPRQIVAKNGVKGIDATSRATITGEAIINASAKALASGAK